MTQPDVKELAAAVFSATHILEFWVNDHRLMLFQKYNTDGKVVGGAIVAWNGHTLPANDDIENTLPEFKVTNRNYRCVFLEKSI